MIYVSDFDSCRAKVHWAYRHCKSLKGDLGGHLWEEAPIFRDDTKRVSIVAQLEPDTGEHSIQIAAIPEKILALLSMEFADCIHNLRTALDHLAWQLALEHYGGVNPPKREQRWVSFPIVASSEALKGHSAAPHFNTTRLETLSRFQKYSGEDGEIIRAIHKMDLTDKHRVLLDFHLIIEEFSAFPARALSVDLSMGTEVFAEGIKVGTEIMRMRFNPSDPNLQAKMYSDLTPRVLVPEFGFHHLWGHPVTFLSAGIGAVGRCIEAFEAKPA